MDENCGYIILVSRLNDLLINAGTGLFNAFFWGNEGYAQTIADTRHYYTHYGKSKEQKALKGEALIERLASGDRDHILSGVFNQFLSEKSEPAE